MDKGNQTFTSYGFDTDVSDFIMDKTMEDPEWMSIKLGHIHSHNTMSVFFSGTDTDELLENCHHHNVYLSLIVNNFMEMTSKLVYKATPCAYKTKDESGEEYEFGEIGVERSIMLTHDCNIEMPIYEEFIDPIFAKRTEDIIKKPSHQNQTKESHQWNNKKDSETPNQPNLKINPLDNKKSWDNKENPAQAAFDRLLDGKPIGKIHVDGDNFVPETGMEVDRLFACYLIRGGVMFPNDTVEEALEVAKSEGVDGELISKAIMPNIGSWYSKFMIAVEEMVTIEDLSMDDFLMTLENVVDELSDFEAKFDFLPILISEMRQLIEFTENSWKDVVFGNATPKDVKI